LSDKIVVESQINLQLTDKILLDLNSNSNLLLEYGGVWKAFWWYIILKLL